MRNDHNFFLGRMYFISNGGYQNTFVYESILNILELKKYIYKGTDYVLSWKSNEVYNSKLKTMCTASLTSSKFTVNTLE